MKILWYIFLCLQRILASKLIHRVFIRDGSHKSLDLYNVFEQDFSHLIRLHGYSSGFKLFYSSSEYNEDLLAIFQSHKNNFFIDYNRKDGHFRV